MEIDYIYAGYKHYPCRSTGCQVQKDIDCGFLSPMLVDCKGKKKKGKEAKLYCGSLAAIS